MKEISLVKTSAGDEWATSSNVDCSEIRALWAAARPKLFDGDQPGITCADIKRVAELCERATVRLSAMYVASTAETEEAALEKPLCEIRRAYSAFLGSLMAQGLGRKAGASLRRAILDFGDEATKCWLEVERICDVFGEHACRDEAARAAGKLMVTLSRWESVPRTNQAARKRRLAKQVKQMRDCAREVLQLKKTDDEDDAKDQDEADRIIASVVNKASGGSEEPATEQKQPQQGASRNVDDLAEAVRKLNIADDDDDDQEDGDLNNKNGDKGNAIARKRALLARCLQSMEHFWIHLVRHEMKPTSSVSTDESQDAFESFVARGDKCVGKLDELCCLLECAENGFDDDFDDEDDFEDDDAASLDEEEWAEVVSDLSKLLRFDGSCVDTALLAGAVRHLEASVIGVEN
ncbi:unnamed protein product [Amoebophrya sp. A25]|nr:unnamed protein product [Amoebophrya sp. A25]|eukprot:GSA25T00007523001.1